MNSRVLKLLQRLECDECIYIKSPENVFYYSGFSGEGSLIISSKRCVLITDFRYVLDAKIKATDFEIYDIKNGLKDAFGSEYKVVYIENNYITYEAYCKLSEELSGVSFKDAASLFSDREVKDEDEISKIKKASSIAEKAFENVLKLVCEDVTEKQLALEFEYFAKKNGADAISFDTIVASGKNSAMPHAIVTDKKIQKGDFITFDFGCKVGGYCSDMTRTVAYSFATDKMKKVYDIVLEAQLEGLKNAKSGKRCSDVDKAARDIINSYGYGKEFGHALGHGVGIKVHEKPTLSPRSDAVLEDNMLVTIEPGIYIDGEFGVRIEDLVVICGQNGEILTKFEKNLIII